MGLFGETAKLAAELNLGGNFVSNLKGAEKSLGTFDAKLAKTSDRGYRAGQQIGTGIKNAAKIAAAGIGFLASQVAAGTNQLLLLEKATAQTDAALASTKGASGQTAGSIRALAEAYEGLNATIDDKVIQSGENLLLSFTKIRKDAFEPALLAALDLNTRLGGGEGGLQNTIKLVGKALNDPLKGLGALSRAGVTFDAQTTKQIKTLIKQNDLFGAQQIILRKLGERFGGSFAAEGKTAAGTIKGIGDAVEDLQKGLATALFPTIAKVLPRIRDALTSPAVIADVSKLGDAIADLFSSENIDQGAKLISGALDTARSAAPVIADAAGKVAGFVGAAVKAFMSLPKELQAIAVGGFAINKLTGGLITNIAGGVLGEITKRGSTPANPVFVSDVAGGLGGGITKGGGLAGIVGAVIPLVVTAAVLSAIAEVAAPFVQQQLGIGPDSDPRGTKVGDLGPFQIIAGKNYAAIARQQSANDAALKAATGAGKAADDLAIAAKLLSAAGHDQSEAARFFHQTTEEARKQADHGIAVGILGPKQKGDPASFLGHTPQRTFIERNTSSKAVKVADIFTRSFATGSSKYSRSTEKAAAALEALKGLQRRLIARGDANSLRQAARVGKDIGILKQVLHTDVRGTTKAIQHKKTTTTVKVNVPISNKTYFNGRIFQANFERYISFKQTHGGSI